MRDWIGIAFFAAAAWLLRAGLVHKRRVLAARAAAAARGVVPAEPGLHSVAVFGEIMRPIILFLLAYAAIKTVVLFVMLGGEEVFSLVDLAGALALLAGYGTWMSLRTTYRLSDLAVAAEAPADDPADAVGTTSAAIPSYVGTPANDRGPSDGGLAPARRAR